MFSDFERQLNATHQQLSDWFDPFSTSLNRRQANVPTSTEKSDGPGEKPKDKQPDDGPQNIHVASDKILQITLQIINYLHKRLLMSPIAGFWKKDVGGLTRLTYLFSNHDPKPTPWTTRFRTKSSNALLSEHHFVSLATWPRIPTARVYSWSERFVDTLGWLEDCRKGLNQSRENFSQTASRQ